MNETWTPEALMNKIEVDSLIEQGKPLPEYLSSWVFALSSGEKTAPIPESVVKEWVGYDMTHPSIENIDTQPKMERVSTYAYKSQIQLAQEHNECEYGRLIPAQPLNIEPDIVNGRILFRAEVDASQIGAFIEEVDRVLKSIMKDSPQFFEALKDLADE